MQICFANFTIITKYSIGCCNMQNSFATFTIVIKYSFGCSNTPNFYTKVLPCKDIGCCNFQNCVQLLQNTQLFACRICKNVCYVYNTQFLASICKTFNRLLQMQNTIEWFNLYIHPCCFKFYQNMQLLFIFFARAHVLQLYYKN